MARNSKLLLPYAPQPHPPAFDYRYLMQELRHISYSVKTLIDMTPQPATQAPKTLKDGMMRLARSPWHPAAGQTQDAWVYWDAPTATWLLV